MKNLFTTLTLALAVFSLSCSEGVSKPEFTATAKGVGPVLLNLPVAQIPESSDGLYDAVTTEQITDDYEGDYTVLHFSQAGKPVIDAYVYGDEIGSITITGSNIGSPEGICPGTKVKELFDKGAKAEMSNDGQMTLALGELRFVVSGMKAACEMKLQSAYSTGAAPEIYADDFEGSAKVENILIF